MIVKNIGEEFTPEELAGETSRINNGVTITVYTGDEPEIQAASVVIPPNWVGFKKSIWRNQALYFGITARAVPNMFSTVLKILSDGEAGTGDQEDLGAILNTKDGNGNYVIGFNWSDAEKQTINGYLEVCNFTIRLI